MSIYYKSWPHVVIKYTYQSFDVKCMHSRNAVSLFVLAIVYCVINRSIVAPCVSVRHKNLRIFVETAMNGQSTIEMNNKNHEWCTNALNGTERTMCNILVKLPLSSNHKIVSTYYYKALWNTWRWNIRANVLLLERQETDRLLPLNAHRRCKYSCVHNGISVLYNGISALRNGISVLWFFPS